MLKTHYKVRTKTSQIQTHARTDTRNHKHLSKKSFIQQMLYVHVSYRLGSVNKLHRSLTHVIAAMKTLTQH